MMRALIAALASTICIAMLAAPVHAIEGEIKVLILDKGFANPPENGEELKRMGEVNGRLMLGYTDYKGNLTIWRGERGLYLVNALPMEEYVEGVVRAEIGRGWELEAMKAQAVAARTYALSRLGTTPHSEFDVVSSVLHQVYRGLNADTEVSAAVRATRGEILVYNSKPIQALYHSTSLGKTEVAEEVFGNAFPYLQSVDADGSGSPYAVWTRRIPVREVQDAVSVDGLMDIRVTERTKTGRAKTVEIYAAEGLLIKSIKAADLRKALGWKRLPSTDFDMHMEGSEVVVEGKGFGHGVGMCQWSAQGMALKGSNYKEILSHFYPGAQIRLMGDVYR